MPKQELMSASVCIWKHLIYELSTKNTFIISAQNILEIHFTPQHISSSVQRCRIVAISLAGIHNVMVRCLFVVNSSSIHKTFLSVPPRKTSRGMKSSKCGGHSVGPSLPIHWSG
jgi:hypothetical protein